MSLTTSQVNVAPERSGAHLVNPTLDFLMLGGISLFVFPVLVALPGAALTTAFLYGSHVVSNALNFPHFAISYRIFYEDFGRKTATPGLLRYRYLFAGIVVPVLLVVGVAIPMIMGAPRELGYAYNVMVFFVGWHYVKQGYGMAMVDAALKRRFFDGREKTLLRANAYAAWVTAWMIGNRYYDRDEHIGLPVELIPIPDAVFAVSVVAVVATTAATVSAMARRAAIGRPTAWTGVVAYLVSLYLWMVFVSFDPLILIVVPALHSLQYLYVVRRYELNREAAEPDRLGWRSQYKRSVVLGALMFWIIPLALDTSVGYDDELFGPLAFLFMFWVVINVHHYFLDNVMWRRDNPEVSRHLFGAH